MSDRRCTTCRRPCSGHTGPTGPHCGLTPLMESELELDVTGATGGTVKSTDAKLDKLSSQFELLLGVVTDLTGRLEVTESAVKKSALVEHSRKAAGEALGLPGPAWPATPPPIPLRTSVPNANAVPAGVLGMIPRRASVPVQLPQWLCLHKL
jgi:hypothetical protein